MENEARIGLDRRFVDERLNVRRMRSGLLVGHGSSEFAVATVSCRAGSGSRSVTQPRKSAGKASTTNAARQDAWRCRR